MKNMNPKWDTWLRTVIKDPASPAQFRGSLGMLTGQDRRALAAIAACWQLYASADADGERAALAAIRALLPGMQDKCRPFARELIPYALDWPDRERLWPLVEDAS